MPAKTYSEILCLNVGHLLSRSIGFSRKIHFSGQHIVVASDLMLARLSGETRLTRIHLGILVEGTMDAIRDMECVRCLSVYTLNSEVNISELYTYPPDPEADWTIDENCLLNISPLLRELLLVEEPIQALCSQDCKGLCPDCGQDRNQVVCACTRESGDPRLAVLKELLETD